MSIATTDKPVGTDYGLPAVKTKTTPTPAASSPVPSGRGGRPKGSKGNGKTHDEKVARLKRQRELFQLELEAKGEAARQELAATIEARRAAQQTRVLDMYEVQESKRSAQFQIDQKPTLVVLVVLAAFAFLITAALTADGTIGSSLSARFAVDWFGYLLFGAFEVGILVFMLVYYVNGSRIDIVTGERVKATGWFVGMVVVSAITVLLSAYHVLDVYDYAWQSIDMWVGIGIRVAVSVLFVVISKAIATTLFAKAVDLSQIAEHVGAER